MQKDHLRAEYHRLQNSRNSKDRIESYDKVIDTAFKLLHDHQNKKYNNQIDEEANLIYQLLILKNLSIRKLISGIHYTNSLVNFKIKGLIDLFSIYSIIRSQFEGYCNFNNIYIKPKNEDEKRVIYFLWVISGLKFRQRFKIAAITDEGKEKILNEKKQIEIYTKYIFDSEIYSKLNEKDKKKVNNAIDNKKFQICFENNNVRTLSWREMLSNAGVSDQFDEMYNHLSLSTHPSNVSVFQFKDLYKDNSYITLSIFAMEIGKYITTFLMRDYCEYFGELKLIFNTLPVMNQLLINGINKLFRGDSYQLNDILNILN